MTTTTIQISGATKQLLVYFKKKERVKTYDHLLQRLLRKKTKVPKSLFGSAKGLTWSKEDRMDFHEY